MAMKTNKRWQETEFGYQLLHPKPAWKTKPSDILAFVVVNEPVNFKIIQRLNREWSEGNQPPCECRWIGEIGETFPQDSDSEASVQTVDDDPGAGGCGIIALCAPSYKAAKEQKNLEPLSFVFGRKTKPKSRYADVWVSADGRHSRTGFALSVEDGYWVVYSLEPTLKIHRDTLLRKGTERKMALHPQQANIIEWNYPIRPRPPVGSHLDHSQNGAKEGSIEFVVYVQHPQHLVQCLDDNVVLPEDGQSSCVSGTTAGLSTQESLEDAEDAEQPERLYILDDEIGDRHNRLKVLSLDPFTRKEYVAKVYEESDKSMLLKRLSLTSKLPRTKNFICDESVRIHFGKAYLLNPYQLGLEEVACVQPTLPAARNLLWFLLRAVHELHTYGIYHNDICTYTVLTDDHLSPASLFLGGFSEASADPSGAVNDCFKIFQTVGDFTRSFRELPEAWTGNEALDELWKKSLEGQATWDHTVRDVCQIVRLNPDKRDELWSTLSLKFTIELSCIFVHQTMYLDRLEIEKYLRKDAVRCAGMAADSKEIRALYEMAQTALLPRIQSERVSLEGYQKFQDHMKHRHKSNVGRLLALELEGRLQSLELEARLKGSATVTFPMVIDVSYHAACGLVNISHLAMLSIHDNSDVLQSTGNQTPKFEVRGPRGLGGIYMHAHTALDILSREIEFQYDESQVCDQRDTTYDPFTIANWALLVSNEAASPCPYSKESELVNLKDNTHISLGQFLAQRVPRTEYMDVFASHGELHGFRGGPTKEHSCTGSVLSDDEVEFKFMVPE